MAASTSVLREYLLKLGFQINEKGNRDFDNTLKKVEKGANRAGLAVAAFAAAAVTAAYVYMRSMERMYFASQRLNTPVRQLQALEYAAGNFGISAGEMQGALQGFTSAIRANPGLRALMAGFGVKTTGRTNADQMLDLIKAIAAMPRENGERIAAMYGIDPVLFDTMARNLAEINRLMREREEMNKALGVDVDKNAESMHQWMNEIRRVGAEFEVLQGVVATFSLEAGKDLSGVAIQVMQDWSRILSSSAGKGGFGGLLDLWAEGMGLKKVGGGVVLSGNGKGGEVSTSKQGGLADWHDRVRANLLNLGHEKEAGGGRGFSYPTMPESDTGMASANISDPQAKMAALEKKYGLPTGLLDGMWNAESGRGRNMTSPVGARGHFQFMPGTAAEYGIAGQEDDFDLSSDAAARKMKGLLKRYGGNVDQALGGYNWGEGNMAKNGNNLGAAPNETKGYVAKITGSMAQTNNFNITGSNPTAIADAVGVRLAEANGNVLRDVGQRVVK